MFENVPNELSQYVDDRQAQLMREANNERLAKQIRPKGHTVRQRVGKAMVRVGEFLQNPD